MNPVLQISALKKAYGALKVTDGLSLSVRAGEIHALIGPNGAGKTTLVAQISGEVPPDDGSINFAGTDITGLSMAARSHLGLARTFQITSVLNGFSVLQNVEVAAQAHDGHSFRFLRPVREEVLLRDRAMTALETVGLSKRAGVRAGDLSHGEKRQLEIAMALATSPSLILMDEPMAGTGREETARLVETLKGLRGTVTILLIEHDMDAVFALADRVSVLVAGAVIAEGTPDEIRRDARVREAYLGEEGAL